MINIPCVRYPLVAACNYFPLSVPGSWLVSQPQCIPWMNPYIPCFWKSCSTKKMFLLSSWKCFIISWGFFNSIGSVLKTPPWFADWLSQSSFSSIFSKHHNYQSVRARELKFWENFHPTLCVMCHISHVTCHMSPVICHLSRVTCHLSHVTCYVSAFLIYFFLIKK